MKASKQEIILGIALESIDENKENYNCGSNNAAIGEIVDEQYHGDYILFLQYILENMTIEEFQKIKQLDE
jgi:hypothetical protein